MKKKKGNSYLSELAFIQLFSIINIHYLFIDLFILPETFAIITQSIQKY